MAITYSYVPVTVPAPDWGAESLSFTLEYEGRHYRVIVTYEAMTHRYGARSSDRLELDRAFTLDFAAIQAQAAELIRERKVPANENGEVTLDGKKLMRVIYKEAVTQWREGEVIARQATRRLEEIVGPSAPGLTLAWDAVFPRGVYHFTMQIYDKDVGVTSTFSPEELRSPARSRARLLEIWGDFLQLRSHFELRALMSTEEATGK